MIGAGVFFFFFFDARACPRATNRSGSNAFSESLSPFPPHFMSEQRAHVEEGSISLEAKIVICNRKILIFALSGVNIMNANRRANASVWGCVTALTRLRM